MKIAVILVILLVLISAESIGGKEHANAKEVAHHKEDKEAEEKANKYQEHGKSEVVENVEDDHEKKNTHKKSANHQSRKGKKKTHAGKVEESHTSKQKGSNNAKKHSKDAKNHSPAKKAAQKNAHPHQTKGKDNHINKKAEVSHKTKNISHKVSPKRQIEKISSNDKTKQHLVGTNNSVGHIQTNLTAKVVKSQQMRHTQSTSSISNETNLKETPVSASNSSYAIANAKEANISKASPLLYSPISEALNKTVIGQQESSTESEEDSDEEQSSDSETQKQTVVKGNITKNKNIKNKTVKKDNPASPVNKTQFKQLATKEINSTLIVKEKNPLKALPEAEANQTKTQQAPKKQEKIEENHKKIQETSIKQEDKKTVIIKDDLPKPQVKQALPKQQEAHTSVSTKKDSPASNQEAKQTFHTRVEKKTDTVTIDASAYKESEKTQTSIPPPPQKQAAETKNEAVQQKPVQTKAPQAERHLKVQQSKQDDIDKLLRQVSTQKAKQKSKIADQILDLQVKLHQEPVKEETSLTLYVIFFFLAILIAVPIIKCLTKANDHSSSGQPMIQFQEQDSTRLSGPQSGDNLEEMI